MFGQGAHQDNHALTDRVVAGVLGGVLQKLLKHWQQGAYIVLIHKANGYKTAFTTVKMYILKTLNQCVHSFQ